MVRAFLLLFSIPLLMTSAHDTVWCSRDVLVSNNRSLLPLDNITALYGANELPQYPLRDIVSSGSHQLWCASSTAGNYVNMTFTQPVVVEGIFSLGAFSTGSQIRDHYVSNFSIHFSQDVNGQLQLYHKQFTAMSPAIAYYVGESITAQKLQFQINEYGPDAEFCWNIHLIGCTTDNAINLTPPTPFECPASSEQSHIPRATNMVSPTPSENPASSEHSHIPRVTNMASPTPSENPASSEQSDIPRVTNMASPTPSESLRCCDQSGSELCPPSSLYLVGAGMLGVGVVMMVTTLVCWVIMWTKCRNNSPPVRSKTLTHKQDKGGLSSMRNNIGITERTTSTAVTSEDGESETVRDLIEVNVYDYVMDISTPCLPNKENQTVQRHLLFEANPSYSTSKVATASQDYEVPVATNSAYAHHAPTTPH